MNPRAAAQHSALRIALALTISLALLLSVSTPELVAVFAQGQSQSARVARPRPGKPEGDLPNLEEVKSESQREREAPPPIPSTVRSRKNPLQPWDGRRVGDPGTRGELGQVRRAHARRRPSAPPPLPDDQFVQNFFSWALLRNPNSSEATYFHDQLRVAYPRGQTSLKLAAIELGKTLFEAAEYLNRGRDNHSFVYDLYKTYLRRDPDAGGWAYWEALLPTIGRESVRRGFEESTEFATLLASLTLNGVASGNPAKVLIHPFSYIGTLNGDQARLFYALTALHEVFHLAARGGYDDEDMAEVVSEITGWSLPPNGSDVMTYSNFWERYLMDHCRTDSVRNLK